MALPPKVWPGNVKNFQESAIFQSIRTLLARNKSAVSAGPIVPDEDAQSLRSRGNELLAQGRISEATDCYRQVVAMTPNDGLAHVNLGYGLMELGELPEASASFRQALALDGGLLDAHFLMGQVQMRQTLVEDAVRSFRAALTLKPDFDLAWFELARVQENLHQVDAALDSYQQVLRINPAFVDAAANQVKLLLDLQRWQEVITVADGQMKNGAPHGFGIQKACALNGLARHDEALALIDAILAEHPGNVPALDGKAAIQAAQGKHALALQSYEQVIALQPQHADALSNAGAACDRLGRLDQAMAFHERAVSLQPQNTHVLYNMGCTLLNLGRCAEVVTVADRGLAAEGDHANLHWNKAVAHLLLGDLRQGWPEYEWRWFASALGPRPPRPNFGKPIWTGESLIGKSIFLYGEQGLGDTIQLLRYIPLIATRGAKVFLSVPASIEPLCADFKDDCILVGRGQLPGDFDFHCPLFSLPFAFETDLTSIPAAIPYLRSIPALKTGWEGELRKLSTERGPRLGLVWSGSATHQNDANRSMPLATLLDALPQSCQLVCLQKEVREADQELVESAGIFFAGDALKTFEDTVALADCVDLVISVDTSVAHLVGAMGKPLWLMLPYRPDWRWMLERDDSPWYPTARLFRQGESRCWEEVVKKVGSELPKALEHIKMEG